MTKAFAPGNPSCVFVICPDKDPAKMGSLGVGISLQKGVIVSAKKSRKLVVKVNDKNMYFPTVLDVIRELAEEPVFVKIKYHFPYGCGFGMSGASALATAYALNELFKLKKTNRELAMIAHIAEVNNRTGLGDVGGQFNGGITAKYEKGNPLKGIRLPIKNEYIYYKIFGPIDTKKVITNEKIRGRINKAGLLALKKIKSLRKKNLSDIIRISKEFSVKSGLLRDKRVKSLIAEIEKDGNAASMVMLGNAVYSDKPFKGCNRARISYEGARVLK